MNQQELSHALRKEAIKNGHSVQTLASGYSMFPFLRKGDILTVEPIPLDKVKRGDVVVFESEEKWIAHRVIKICNYNSQIKLITRGDSRISNDPIVIDSNFVGVTSNIQRKNTFVSLSSPSRRISTRFHLIGGVMLSFFLNLWTRKYLK